jgi:uncharacterized protein
MPTIEEARLWYPRDDPVHGFDHVLRVYQLAERLAKSTGADLEIVKAAVLLHDIPVETEGESLPSAQKASQANDQAEIHDRGEHHQRSAELAAGILRRGGWDDDRIAAVQHCILAHRFRDKSNIPMTLEAKVVFDADKLDAIGAVGAARAVAYASMNGMPVYAPPSRLFLERGRLEPSEPHSAYHEYLFKLIKINERLFTTEAKQLAVIRQQRMKEFFEGLVEEIEAR